MCCPTVRRTAPHDSALLLPNKSGTQLHEISCVADSRLQQRQRSIASQRQILSCEHSQDPRRRRGLLCSKRFLRPSKKQDADHELSNDQTLPRTAKHFRSHSSDISTRHLSPIWAGLSISSIMLLLRTHLCATTRGRQGAISCSTPPYSMPPVVSWWHR